jgi:S-DNA-T family DNA segregation ATPase FtsK/SpoIIIE
MRKQVLEFQANRIEAVLAQHQVSARVTGGLVSPRWIRFNLRPAIGARTDQALEMGQALAMALDVDVCHVSRQNGSLLLDVPRPDPQPLRLLPVQRKLVERSEIPLGAAVIGLAENGAPLLVRLPSHHVAHVHITGADGAGKSALLRALVTSLALRHRSEQLHFVLVDPKRRTFGPLAGLSNLRWPVLSDPTAVAQATQSLVGLMLDREQGGWSPDTEQRTGEPRIVLAIDELDDLLTFQAIHRALTWLARRGRRAGIHLVACARHPSDELLADFPVRLAASLDEAPAATGTRQLRGPGRFVAMANGQAIRFDAVYITGREAAEVVCCKLRAERESRGEVVTSATVSRSEKPARRGIIERVVDGVFRFVSKLLEWGQSPAS